MCAGIQFFSTPEGSFRALRRDGEGQVEQDHDRAIWELSHRTIRMIITLLIGSLHRHPFPVRAHFERVVAVSFAFPQAVLNPLVPPCLVLDTHDGLGFVTVAMVWTRKLRPVGFPAWLGRDFFLAGYRVFTRIRDESGRNLRGLRILRSETDQAGMVMIGNLLTAYNYRRVRVRTESVETRTHVQTRLPCGLCTLDLTFDTADGGLPDGSPFADWRAARRFAGPMPFTFSPEADGRVVVIEGSRTTWSPRPVRVGPWAVSLFQESPFANVEPVLANAFLVENIDYQWSKGRLATPMPTAP